MAIKSVPRSFCNVRDEYIHRIVTLFSNLPDRVTPEIVKRLIPLLSEEDCDFQKTYLATVKKYSTQVQLLSFGNHVRNSRSSYYR